MGEKGNAEVIEQLREMAQQQEPSLRNRVMQLLSDYQTLTGLAGGGDDDDADGSGSPAPSPQA
jgi:hypothetical protein